MAKYQERLDSRIKIGPQEFDTLMSEREATFGKKGYTPKVSLHFFFISNLMFIG
jgi:hypothetical protein